MVHLIIAWLAISAVATAQPVSEPMKGVVELSVGQATPMVGVSVDFVGANGSADGFIDALFLVQLQLGAAKPSAFKEEGEVTFAEDRFLTIRTRNGIFSLVVDAPERRATSRVAYYADAVRVMRARSANKADPQTHAQATAFFLSQPRLPPRRKPPGR